LPYYFGKPLSLETWYHLPATVDSVRITKFKCYISQIELFRNQKQIYSYPQQAILIDATNPDSYCITLPEDVQYDEFRCVVGLDSHINSMGALDGALDPVHGMYWTWQTGYIHFKLEGFASYCTSQQHQFQFHIGGSRQPFATHIAVAVTDIQGKSHIPFHLDDCLSKGVVTKQHTIMSPGKAAVDFASHFAHMFNSIRP
jgi:hypothetical protein